MAGDAEAELEGNRTGRRPPLQDPCWLPDLLLPLVCGTVLVSHAAALAAGLLSRSGRRWSRRRRPPAAASAARRI